MTDERLSEVETKLYTHEGRIKHTEQDLRQVVHNIDRIEEHMLQGAGKSVNYMPIVSGVVGFLGVVGTAVFGIMNYVDLQLQHVDDKKSIAELRISETSVQLRTLEQIVHDRLGRLEERASTLEKDINDHEDSDDH